MKTKLEDASFDRSNVVIFESVLISPGVQEVITKAEVQTALQRHVQEWADVWLEDRQEDELSLPDGACMLSVYHSQAGVKCWVVTKPDLSSTLLLLPEEY